MSLEAVEAGCKGGCFKTCLVNSTLDGKKLEWNKEVIPFQDNNLVIF